MSEIAVRVENLGKCYHIGQAKSGDFRESFGGWVNKLRGRTSGQTPLSKEFWALEDITFEVKKGEAVGIIGRNGAGKSTLLKILSRITEPTRGRFEIKGRVSSLLEVGTGFHPELSGRENIYLNGTILGMKRREIKTKFDEIVGFSGVEKFIDTPVKHYSSGMKVRLAFSVAAHLEPEILIIDEVLAVGDAEFQKKCLGKMEDVTGEGRTVLFVSHNMGAIKNLCSSGILLDKGSILLNDDINKVISEYVIQAEKDPKILTVSSQGKKNYLSSFKLSRGVINSGDSIDFEIGYSFEEKVENPEFSIIIFSQEGVRVCSFVNGYQESSIPQKLQGEGKVVCKIPSFSLTSGHYFISLKLWQPGQLLDDIDYIGKIQVENNFQIADAKWDKEGLGSLFLKGEWKTR